MNSGASASVMYREIRLVGIHSTRCKMLIGVVSKTHVTIKLYSLLIQLQCHQSDGESNRIRKLTGGLGLVMPP